MSIKISKVIFKAGINYFYTVSCIQWWGAGGWIEWNTAENQVGCFVCKLTGPPEKDGPLWIVCIEQLSQVRILYEHSLDLDISAGRLGSIPTRIYVQRYFIFIIYVLRNGYCSETQHSSIGDPSVAQTAPPFLSKEFLTQPSCPPQPPIWQQHSIFMTNNPFLI